MQSEHRSDPLAACVEPGAKHVLDVAEPTFAVADSPDCHEAAPAVHGDVGRVVVNTRGRLEDALLTKTFPTRAEAAGKRDVPVA